MATASAPAPKSPTLEVPPANITVVRTAEQLQRAALSGVVDIEIRAHLDLRSLQINPNPSFSGLETETNQKRLALLYAFASSRSLRGNCSDSDAVSDVGLAPGTFPDMLPLKPRQCLLVVDHTWLMVNRGRLWIDNVYVKLSRRIVQPHFAFITAGALNGELQWEAVDRSTIYITGSTFQAEHRGNARALVGDFTGVSFYVDECIFTDWGGFASVVTLKFQSVATIRNTVFRNMHLPVELADVSFEGIVHFHNVSLANVTLEHGAVVSTTGNDYQAAIGFYLTYYAEDDADYDVALEPVPIGDRSVFGEEFRIVDDTMSDCVYLLRPPDSVLPGCPETSKVARNRTIDRGFGDSMNRESTGVPFGGDGVIFAPEDYVSDYVSEYAYGPQAFDYTADGPAYTIDVANSPGRISDFDVINDPQLRFTVLLVQPGDEWLQATQQVLPTLSSAPDWPPFLPPASPPRVRNSLQPDPVTPSPATAAAILGPLRLTEQPRAQPGGSGHGQWGLSFMAFGLIVPLLLCLWVKKRSQLARCCCCWRVKAEPHRAVLHQGEQSPTASLRARKLSRSVDDAADRGIATSRSRAGSVVSRGADVPPPSALNTDYEYILPPHLSMLACSPSAPASQSECEPGSTVVLAPYTVDSESIHHDAASIAAGQTAFASVGDKTSGTEDAVQCSNQSSLCGVSVKKDLPQHTRVFGNVTVDSGEISDLPHRSTALGVEGSKSEGWTRQGRAGLAQCIDVTQQTTDLAASSHAVRRLQRQLDSFNAGDVFLGRFEMLGRHHRRRGGQAVVQFAAGKDRAEFAVKFFLDRAAFLTEAALYAAAFPSVRSTASPAVLMRADETATTEGGDAAVPMSDVVARFLPQVEAVCDGPTGGLEDPRGRPLPPCIVMEKGESLQDLCDRAEPDVFTVFSVLSNVSRRLADMHAAGYVHRDLKPANIMWLPRQNRWTVIDFGCVARVGEHAPLSFTLAYAPPEVVNISINAWWGEQGSIEARPALDAWSLGVTAFELLTGAPAFDLLAHGRCKVMAMLAGDLPLPWEGELSKDVRAKLGVLGGPVLQLLHKEPACRSTLETFHASCTHIFATSTSTAHTQA